MPFIPKSWGNFSTGGTPLDAAGLNDLEARIAAGANTGSSTTNAVYAYDYGVRADGVTPSAGFLQDACDAAQADALGVVFVPGGQLSPFGRIQMEAPVFVPDGVRIVGTGRRSTVFIAIPGTFPTSTPMFYLGSNVFLSPEFDIRLENLGIGMSDIAGSTCVYSRNCQEGSGLEHVGLYDFKSYGAWFDTGGAQNFACHDLEVYGGTGSLAGVYILGTSQGSVDNATVNTDNATTGAGILIQTSYAINLSQIHCEGNKYGVNVVSGVTNITGITGSASTNTVVHFDFATYNCSVINSHAASSPNHIVDDFTGATVLGSDYNVIPFYSQLGALPNVGVRAVGESANVFQPYASLGKFHYVPVTNATAKTIAAPIGAISGQEITFDIANGTGSALGAITWNAVFKLAGAFTNPLAGKRRTIRFYYDATNWVEVNRSAADI